MASRGLRTLCLTYTDFPASAPGRPEDFFETSHDEDLVVNCIVGIKVCAGALGSLGVGSVSTTGKSQAWHANTAVHCIPVA
jgi:hypothetical protein